MADVDIFAAVEAARQEDNGGNAPSDDTEMLFVGSKQAGKSTIINNFLGKDEAPKPTAALEFRFARRSAGSHNATAVANVWELGGGTQLAELLKVVLVPGRLSRCMVVITLDMSSPNDALATLLFWLQAVRQHVDKAIAQLKAMASGAAKYQATKRRTAEVWEGHEDKGTVRPMGVALLILAFKWDEFEAAFPESDYKKLACRALRYYAHLNGASLACAQHKDKQMMGSVRNLLFQHAFSAQPVRATQLDYSKPIVAPAGLDTFAGIGNPPTIQGVSADRPEEAWKAAFEVTFPPAKESAPGADLSAVESEQFAEEAIDELRRQKRAEVGKLRREARLEERLNQ